MSARELSSPDPLKLLYTDHHRWLAGWLRSKLGCPHHAADLAHDTFLRVLVRREFDTIHEPRAYLATIAHGLMVDHVRRRELERAYLETIAGLPEPEAPSPETRLLILEALARIDALLDGLNPKVRAAFLLSRLEGLSYPEIAAHLGVSLSSVEKYIAAAIRHCYTARHGA